MSESSPRPKEFLYFECLWVVAIILFVVNKTPSVLQEIRSEDFSPFVMTVLVLIDVFFLCIYSWVVYQVSRRQERWGLWSLLALYTVGLLNVLLGVLAGRPIYYNEALEVLIAILAGASFPLMFTDAARAWFRNAGE